MTTCADRADLRLEAVDCGTLTDVRLQVDAGTCAGLAGPSGCGKTRLLRVIADLDPHAGQVWLGELEQASVPASSWRRQVQLVPAEAQWWAARVGEHFPEGAVPDWSALGFESDVAGWSVTRLSSGERQRLGVLRALAFQPRALLLDEPTANLDAASSARVERLLLQYMRARGAPLLWVSHDRVQLQRVANACWSVRDGKVVREQAAP